MLLVFLAKIYKLYQRLIHDTAWTWGNSLAWRIPKHIVEELSLELNDEVDCQVENGKIAIEPVSKQKDYTLNKLLDQIIERRVRKFFGGNQREMRCGRLHPTARSFFC